MRTKAVLLSSVSVAAAAAGVSAAHAAPPAPAPYDGFFYSVEGGALFSKNTAFDDKVDEFSGFPGIVDVSGFPSDVGYHAGFSIGHQIDNLWDVNFAFAANRLIDNDASLFASGGTGSVSLGMTTNFAFETGDFEVGYRPELGNDLKVRLFAGVRALHFTENMDKSGTSSGISSGFFQSSTSAEFFGAGPRVGVSIAKRFDGSNFGLSGSLAGAVIVGRQTTTTSYLESIGGPSELPGASETKTVVDVEGNLGLDYYLNDLTTLTVGYHAENLTNIPTGPQFNFSGPPSSEQPVSNKLVHGPFLKLSGGF